MFIALISTHSRIFSSFVRSVYVRSLTVAGVVSFPDSTIVPLMRFLALGWHLEEIHVTCDHLEKKWTRLRLYTKSLKKLCIQSVEMASRVSSDGVRTFEVTASEIW
ncbi:hypothetical protein Tco_0011201 [Tanacetum coccineum]